MFTRGYQHPLCWNPVLSHFLNNQYAQRKWRRVWKNDQIIYMNSWRVVSNHVLIFHPGKTHNSEVANIWGSETNNQVVSLGGRGPRLHENQLPCPVPNHLETENPDPRLGLRHPCIDPGSPNVAEITVHLWHLNWSRNPEAPPRSPASMQRWAA